MMSDQSVVLFNGSTEYTVRFMWLRNGWYNLTITSGPKSVVSYVRENDLMRILGAQLTKP